MTPIEILNRWKFSRISVQGCNCTSTGKKETYRRNDSHPVEVRLWPKVKQFKILFNGQLVSKGRYPTLATDLDRAMARAVSASK